jgi:hypothetical protein
VHLSYVDANDVAVAHCEALSREDASNAPGRFIITSETHGRPGDLAAQLCGIYPTLEFTATHSGCFTNLLKGMSMTKAEGAYLSMEERLDNTLSKERLGMQYVDEETMCRRTVDSMCGPPGDAAIGTGAWVDAEPQEGAEQAWVLARKKA